MLRLIGDVHGKRKDYLKVCNGAEETLQIGDLDFNYSWIYELDPEHHKVIAGNHDNYLKDESGRFMIQTPHFLGDFGTYRAGGIDLFYIRGGRSIDHEFRTEGVDLFRDEELTYQRAMECLMAYKHAQPRVVVSHECPVEAIDFVSKGKTWRGKHIEPSFTAKLLSHCLDSHKPALWVFGHHHESREFVIGSTTFRCLKEMEFYDLEAMP